MSGRRVSVLVREQMIGGVTAREAIVEGIRAAGDEPVIERDATSPVAVCWGWRKGQPLRARGHEVLVMERGYLGDRLGAWTSLGWNGLNGRALRPAAPADGGARFMRHFPHALKPWKTDGKGYALILGQFPGDAAIEGVDMEGFYNHAARRLEEFGYAVRFRPHPAAEARGVRVAALPAHRIGGTLAEALAGAALAVTWNSNSGVDAVLAGVPLIAMDEGSMAWEMAAHDVGVDPVRPSRWEWAARLAWTQWTAEEIASGAAWAHMRQHLPVEIAA